MSATEPNADVDDAAESDETGDGGGSDGSVSDVPPSAKLVYKVLEYEAQLTQEGIAAESRLCPRTVRYALGKLEDRGLVTSRACLEDARQSKYRIAE
ncbi:MarR family transcriptional regulator [Natrinema salsiterrestre]|uniref:MarR family transcriptional regulator n=1 Tax=Natrinema salsiterrestre TaxID=2950540 RepID=A0A9Q4Q1W7_9EURY|nr:helix-turn-helix domain-containing protein [Natrinema salsiterrestre]MDF9745951.1 MarR family transcriptional regulator [Natrinema salsiterrestre]